MPPAAETQTAQTHQAPSPSASAPSSCPVQRGARAEGTQGGSCSPSRGLRSQSNKSQGEHPTASCSVRGSPDVCTFGLSGCLTPVCTRTRACPHTHAHPPLRPGSTSSRPGWLGRIPGKPELRPYPLLSAPQGGLGLLHQHTVASAGPPAHGPAPPSSESSAVSQPPTVGRALPASDPNLVLTDFFLFRPRACPSFRDGAGSTS